MLRVRLKADGRIVEILPDGSERAMAPDEAMPANGAAASQVVNAEAAENAAAYVRRVRAATRLSQNEFANRIAVPVETVRNWEQGKRAPRGPARALLKILDRAPGAAFAVLARKSGVG